MKDLLTYSRQSSFKTCRRKCQYEYEIGLRKTTDAKPLRMGTAYHEGLDVLKQTGDIGQAIHAVLYEYANCPDTYDSYEWEIERETVVCLLNGYAWRWGESQLTWLESESEFRLPLLNPSTYAASQLYDLGGKIDGIATLEDGRTAVVEHKLFAEDIGDDADLWRRLQLDHQITLYLYAARAKNPNVSTVLYDVTRKPTIRPEQIPLLDSYGFKVVLDANGQRVMTKDGKKPRESASKADGWVLQTRAMTVDEWSEKLTADIGARPEWYYQRKEIPRLDQDIDEFMSEMWDIQKSYQEARRENRWYRTVTYSTCPFCAYFGICASKLDLAGGVPECFEIVTNKHPELGEQL